MPRHENQSKTEPRQGQSQQEQLLLSKGGYNERNNEFTNYRYDPKEHIESEE